MNLPLHLPHSSSYLSEMPYWGVYHKTGRRVHGIRKKHPRCGQVGAQLPCPQDILPGPLSAVHADDNQAGIAHPGDGGKMSNQCNLIRDILPLYAEDMKNQHLSIL